MSEGYGSGSGDHGDGRVPGREGGQGHWPAEQGGQGHGQEGRGRGGQGGGHDEGWFRPDPSWPPPDGPWNQPPRRRHRARNTLAALVAAGVAVGAGIGIGHAVWNGSGASAAPPGGRPTGLPTAPATTSPQHTPGASPSGTLGGVAATVAPALVDITTTLGYQGIQAQGTGIVLSSSGEVLTNNHVIDGATRIKATDLGDHRSYTADVVGYDRGHDLAVLQLRNASGLTAARTGSSSGVSVDDRITAIGNAGGQGSAQAAPGSVTALHQSITARDEATGSSEELRGLIEVNADVQPGDSGGPLVDSQGRVIGVDTAASAGFQMGGGSTGTGQGFAVPIDTALDTRSRIDSGHESGGVHIGATAMLGVQVSTPTAGGAGSSPGTGSGSGAAAQPGALVEGLIPGGPAGAAGLAAGDVITGFDGHGVADPSKLTDLVSVHHPGDAVAVQWTDANGAAHHGTVKLASGPPD
jgi:S1-C subfamily serine protease